MVEVAYFEEQLESIKATLDQLSKESAEKTLKSGVRTSRLLS